MTLNGRYSNVPENLIFPSSPFLRQSKALDFVGMVISGFLGRLCSDILIKTKGQTCKCRLSGFHRQGPYIRSVVFLTKKTCSLFCCKIQVGVSYMRFSLFSKIKYQLKICIKTVFSTHIRSGSY